jgi:hypothetical protein
METNLKTVLTALLTSVTFLASSITLAQSNPVAASVQGSVQLSGAVAASLTLAPILAVYAGSSLVVQSVKLVGNVAQITLTSLTQAGQVVIETTGALIQQAGTVVGQTVQVVARGAGYVLLAGSVVLAFVPIAAHAALLHSSRSN